MEQEHTMKLKGQTELSRAGFAGIIPLGTRHVYGRDFTGSPTVTGPFKHGRWFEVLQGLEPVLIMRQSASIWHAFGSAGWTASGSSAATCCKGGLGDAISTDRDLKTYSRYVRSAPESWADRFVGLLEAKRQVAADIS